jgi:hypothetical protein
MRPTVNGRIYGCFHGQVPTGQVAKGPLIEPTGGVLPVALWASSVAGIQSEHILTTGNSATTVPHKGTSAVIAARRVKGMDGT